MKHLYEPHPECEIPNQLSPQDVGYIVGAKQNFEITKKRLAAIDSGFFSAQNSDYIESENQKLRISEQLHHVRTKNTLTPERAARIEDAKRLGLSKGAKVRHRK
ncbi:hypothetical protein EA007_24890, partial [Vibrio anguillarum]|nr:hypothetical protein [Vibrio anguillarum]